MKQAYKSVALINRANRFSGTNWKAETAKFEKDNLGRLPENAQATLYITCVDNVQARFGVAEILKEIGNHRHHGDEPKYWLDFGNSQHTGPSVAVYHRKHSSTQFGEIRNGGKPANDYGKNLENY